MRTGQSFFFPSHGVNNASIKAGLDWLLSQPCKEKMLVFCGIKNAKNIACYPEAKSFFDLLINKREIIIPDSLKSHIILRIPHFEPNLKKNRWKCMGIWESAAFRIMSHSH